MQFDVYYTVFLRAPRESKIDKVWKLRKAAYDLADANQK